MFVIDNLHNPVVKNIECDDVIFWDKSLDYAIEMFDKINNDDIDSNLIKLKSPAYFCTQMWGDDTNAFTRKQFNRNLKNQRRKSIVLDLDCESLEEYKASKKLMIDFANNYNYYLLLYPTISYPEKPHFRAVFIVNRGLSPINYAKAVEWLYSQLGLAITDESDLDIRASRNLPVFINKEQINEVYSNLKDDCEKMNSKLWSKYNLDKEIQIKINNRIKRSTSEPKQLSESTYYYDKNSLIKAWSNFINNNSKTYLEYDNVWKILTSIAKAYVSQEINWSTVEEMSEVLASIDKDKFEEWNAGNLELIKKFTTQDNLEEAKDLLQYDSGILMSLRTKEIKENENHD